MPKNKPVRQIRAADSDTIMVLTPDETEALLNALNVARNLGPKISMLDRVLWKAERAVLNSTFEVYKR